MRHTISRRAFIRCAGLLCLACAAPGRVLASDNGGEEDIRGTVFGGDAPKELWKWSKEGFYYATFPSGQVQCQVCPNRCLLAPGDRSVCRSKVNLNGKLYSLSYGNPCTIHVDPIEKKPLYHFYPSTRIFSIAAAGCNFRCLNCQNWEISQVRPEDVRFVELFPEDVVKAAVERDAPSIAYTYSEAVTYYEYMYDTARAARERNIKNVWVSNGYINPKPLEALLVYLDAANVNLKSFDDGIYRKLNGGTLEPVLETFRHLHASPVWFEMTTLVVPGYVDKPDMIKEMCAWILKELGPDHPLHFLRFFPQYKLNRLAPTPVKTLEQFREIALSEGIHYVYVGNVPGHEGNHTYCHNCKKLLIKRNGYHITENHIKDSRCVFCHTVIPGRWS
jgi:pyruvate formate lyase activating enzyme